jgi:hypothetical protein
MEKTEESESRHRVKIKFPSRGVNDSFGTTLGGEVQCKGDVYHGSEYEGSNIEPRGGFDNLQGKAKFDQDTSPTEGKNGKRADGRKQFME